MTWNPLKRLEMALSRLVWLRSAWDDLESLGMGRNG